MTALVEQARSAVLDFFHASPDEYIAIFTPNATGALRLVGEAYPFRPGDRFLLTGLIALVIRRPRGGRPLVALALGRSGRRWLQKRPD
ncbi:MAG TPA: hypothetical protein VIM33_15655 [Gaiellaceae bacterium]|jgi:hypothetical protein